MTTTVKITLIGNSPADITYVDSDGNRELYTLGLMEEGASTTLSVYSARSLLIEERKSNAKEKGTDGSGD